MFLPKLILELSVVVGGKSQGLEDLVIIEGLVPITCIPQGFEIQVDHPPQVAIAQIGHSHIGTHQIGSVQVGRFQAGLIQVGTAKVGPVQGSAKQLRVVKIGVVQDCDLIYRGGRGDPRE